MSAALLASIPLFAAAAWCLIVAVNEDVPDGLRFSAWIMSISLFLNAITALSHYLRLH